MPIGRREREPSPIPVIATERLEEESNYIIEPNDTIVKLINLLPWIGIMKRML